ncbi:hypothetical protein [Azorhizobium caulinodans]|uniref:hypothetical protein n=1 Tax=Azorhizobium caulinodans TaxID=7 RepID=UPI00130512EB|nr:hypothetical protein [Azorhizobium caulinodans]
MDIDPKLEIVLIWFVFYQMQLAVGGLYLLELGLGVRARRQKKTPDAGHPALRFQWF